LGAEEAVGGAFAWFVGHEVCGCGCGV